MNRMRTFVYTFTLITGIYWNFKSSAVHATRGSPPFESAFYGRRLHQQSSAANATAWAGLPSTVFVVRTAEDFQAALQSGAVHIELQAHLDLSQAEWHGNSSDSSAHFVVPHHVLSIRGKCSQPFPEHSQLEVLTQGRPPFEPQKPQQCLVIIGNGRRSMTPPKSYENGLHVAFSGCMLTRGDPVWLERLYVVGTGSGIEEELIRTDRDMYMTDVTLQGSGGSGEGALRVAEGRTLVAGSAMLDWSPATGGVVRASAATSFFQTSFRRTSLPAGVPLITASGKSGSVRLAQCTFGNVAGTDVIARGTQKPEGNCTSYNSMAGMFVGRSGGQSQADVYSDTLLTVTDVCGGDTETNPLSAAPFGRFATVHDDTFERLMKAAETGTRALPDRSSLNRPYAFSSRCAKEDSRRLRLLNNQSDGKWKFSGVYAFVGIVILCALPCWCCTRQLRRAAALRVAGQGHATGSAEPPARDTDAKVFSAKELFRVDVHRWRTSTSEAEAAVESNAEQQSVTEEAAGGNVSRQGSIESTACCVPCGDRVTERPASAPDTELQSSPNRSACDTHIFMEENRSDSKVSETDQGSVRSHAPLQVAQQCSGSAQSKHVTSGRALGVQDTACLICYEGLGDCVMLPCGHGGYCGKCMRKVLKQGGLCPICRTKAEGVVQVRQDVPIGSRVHAWPLQLQKR